MKSTYQVRNFMRQVDVYRVLVQGENQRSNDTGLSGEGRTENLTLRRYPDSTEKLLEHLDDSRASSFGSTNQNMNNVSIWIEFGSISNSMMDLVSSLGLFEDTKNNLDGQNFCEFVKDVKRGVKH